MKRYFLLLVIMVPIIAGNLNSQTNKSFHYQAVIRDDGNHLIVNESMNFRISIHKTTAEGTIIYSETQTAVSNGYGLVNFAIGEGATIDTLGRIDWSTGPYFLQIELDRYASGTYTSLGSSQLMGVPYAMFAYSGNEGPQGPIGSKGDKGDQGDQGQAGPQGAAGTGLNNKGSWVAATYQPGDYVFDDKSIIDPTICMWILNGNTSYISSQRPYIDLANWIQFTAPKGDKGEQGIQGTTGATGSQGAKGDKGDQGNTGPTGLTGATGTQGNIGATGPQGLKGDQGNIGPIGPPGTTSWIDSTNLVSTQKKVRIGPGSGYGMLAVQGTSSVTDSVLFEVKDKLGRPVFAVYEDGAAVYVNEGAKGSRGGFAVGGRRPGKGMTTDDIMRITKDSVRIYINDTAIHKGSRSGFSVGGRSPSKGLFNDYFEITPDSTRIYINDVSEGKGSRGGFAVGGRHPSKGPGSDYLRVTPDSTRIYVNEQMSKGARGGFAVGGRTSGKGTIKEYMKIYTDSVPEKIASLPRLLWYPNKEAFMSGKVLVESPDSVGTNSMATGYLSKAIGRYSQALGYRSRAYGDYSTAIGKQAEAGTNSFAFGFMAKALNSDAVALGSGAYATGPKSFAFGSVGIDSTGAVTGSTKATGDHAYAFGLGSISSNIGSFALGSNDTASGPFSFAAGYKTKAALWYCTAVGAYSQALGSYSTAIGYRVKASGIASFAAGYSTQSGGWYSSAFGYTSKSTGNYSFAAGNGSIALGGYSTALGGGTNATGSYATATGRSTTAAGNSALSIGYSSVATGDYSLAGGQQSSTSAVGAYSLALGYQTQANGIASVALNNVTIASGYYSTALGTNSIAGCYGSLVIGKYNTTGGSVNSWTPTDPLFIAGNGSSGSPSNALILYKNGNMTILGTLTQNSDIRIKTKIVELNNIMPLLSSIRSVYFNFIDTITHPGGQQIGFIAQDIQKVFPELVSKDNQGFLSVDYSRMTVILLEALKEQQSQIEIANKQNHDLEDRVSRLEKFINKSQK